MVFVVAVVATWILVPGEAGMIWKTFALPLTGLLVALVGVLVFRRLRRRKAPGLQAVPPAMPRRIRAKMLLVS